MSKISEYVEKQNAFNARQAAAIDSVIESTTGLAEDIKGLNDKITELQNSPGGVTPEDAALIDSLEAAGEAAAARIEGVASALKALDQQTPPLAPPA